MDLEIDENPDIDDRISKIEEELPEYVTFLPYLMDVGDNKRLVYGEDIFTVKKELKEYDVAYQELEIENEVPVLSNYSVEIVAPSLWLGAEFVIENWDELVRLFEVLATIYAAKVASGKIELEIISEKSDGSISQIKFEGHPEELEKVPDELKEVVQGD